MKRLVTITAVLAALAAVPEARAQDAGGGRLVKSAGHPVGNSALLHPHAGFETGVVSNVFYEQDGAVTSPVVRALVGGHLGSYRKPSSPEEVNLGEDTGPPEKELLTYQVSGTLQAQQYITNERARDQSKLSGDAGAELVAFPESTVSFFVREHFTRDTQPKNAEAVGNLNRDVNKLVLGLVFSPGGGALKFNARYENRIDVFEENDFGFANRIQHTIGAGSEWRFFPRTKAFLDASFGFFRKLGGDSLPTGEEFATSNPLRVRLGGATNLIPRMTLRSYVGYGRGFYSGGADFSNILFGTEVGYRYSPFGRFTVAYSYDFHDSINANFYRDHSVLLKLDQQLGLFLLGTDFGLRFRGYRGVPMSIGGTTVRDDVIVQARADAAYMYRDWLAFTAQAQLLMDETDFRSTDGDDPSFTRTELTAGVRAAF